MSFEIRLPNWLPPDAADAWTTFYGLFQSDDSERELRYMMQRLATREVMKGAWAELEYFKEVHPSVLIAIVILTWLSAMRGRSLGPGSGPIIGPSPSELATQARTIAGAMQAVHPTIRERKGITDAITLTELNRVTFEKQSEFIDQLINIAPPPRKTRARNAHHIAFVNCLCARLWQPIGRRPYKLVALLTNVVFDVRKKQWDADRVKHCYRSRSRRN
jgi:hypothetical protein